MRTEPPPIERIAPALFVLIWSTGWISARFAAPYADPLTFLSLRYVLAAAALGMLAVATGAAWPKGRTALAHGVVSGVLLHAIYLGGVWWAVARGVPAGISGLIAAVQPILTALLAPALIGERIAPRQWIGVVLGFAGILLVLWPKLAGLAPGALTDVATPLLVNVAAMVSVTLGTFYQKRFLASGDLRTMTIVQYLGAAAVTFPLAVASETLRIEWNPTTVATMAWSVLALSIGAIALLLLLIRRGAVSRAAAVIYLVPPAVAIEAFFLFDERLEPVQIVGMGIAVLGVALAVRR